MVIYGVLNLDMGHQSLWVLPGFSSANVLIVPDTQMDQSHLLTMF